MKNSADLRSLIFVIATLLFQGVVMWTDYVTETSTLMALFVINILAAFICSLINHNHRHCQIFRNRFLNLLTTDLLSLAMFAPSTRLHAVHTLNHHAHFGSEKDWCSYKIVQPQSKGIHRSFAYLIQACRNMKVHRKSLRLSTEMSLSMKVERISLLVYALLTLWFVPKMFLFWLAPSCTLGLLLLLLANLINHDHCDLASESDHSRNFLSPVENFFFFNNGYHTAHHMRPGAHWSVYPEIHKIEVASRISSENKQSSFVRYLLLNYFFTAKN